MSYRIRQNALKALLLVVLLIVSASLTDCASKRSGVYVTKSVTTDGRFNPYMELKSDGTFYIQRAPGKSSSGTYQLEGNTLTIKDETGVTAKGTFQNDGSLLIEGFTFVRK